MDAGDLEKVTTKHITSLTAAFVGGVVPGLIAIYFLKPAWLMEFDVPKLLLFSAAITLPVFVSNCFMLENSRRNPGAYWDEKTLMASIFMTAAFSLIPLFMMYLYPSVRSFRNFFAVVILLEAVLWGTVMIAQIWRYGFSWVLGIEDIKIEEAVEQVIPEMGNEFTSQDVIVALSERHAKVYNEFMLGRSRPIGHSLIAKIVSKLDGTMVERGADVVAKNMNGNLTKCASWKKKII